MKNQYWFYIDPYVHISLKGEAVLLYNTYTGKILEYIRNSLVLRLVKRLLSSRNLRVIPLKKSDLANPLIREFVENVKEYFMGDSIDVSYSEGKPIQMPPIVKIQKDVKYLKAESLRSVGEGIMNYLSEIFLYINDSCPQNCSICDIAYKQFPFCTARKKRNLELNPQHLENFFEEIKSASPVTLNILGGDIFKYSGLKKLLPLIKSLLVECTYYLHYLNVAEHHNGLKILTEGDTRLNIPVTFPVELEKLKIALDSAAAVDMKTNIMFIIQGETDFEKAQALISKFQIEKPSFIPLYNGNNLCLFEDNIYIERTDLEANKILLKDIYARGSINPLNFGRLFIFPDSRVYSNVNASCPGILGKHTIYEIIFREMNSGKSWRKIRKNVMPCKKCVFETLCPPISNYNYAIKKYNLCHIWKER